MNQNPTGRPGESQAVIHRAFVPGAGLGTRLKRLTECRPKPLIPVLGKPLITSAFDQLTAAGVREIVVNTHHRAEVYRRFFPQERYGQTPLRFRHEPVLLETGGGIRNVADLVGDAPFIVYNGDLLSTLPLAPAIAHHLESGAEATLVLRSGGGPLHIALGTPAESADGYRTGQVTDIRNLLGRAPGTYLFSGIYLVSPAFLSRLPEGKHSVITSFLEMIRTGAPLGAIVIDDGLWHDLGTREQYLEAQRLLLEAQGEQAWVHPSARIGKNVTITGATCIGPGVEIGDNARLHHCVLWDDAKVAPGSVLERCIVTDAQSASGTLIDTDI